MMHEAKLRTNNCGPDCRLAEKDLHLVKRSNLKREGIPVRVARRPKPLYPAIRQWRPIPTSAPVVVPDFVVIIESDRMLT